MTAKRLQLRDGNVIRLCRIFGIPDDKKDFFRKMLEVTIREVWRGHGIANKAPRVGKIHKVLDKIKSGSLEEGLAIFSSETPIDEAAWTYLQISAESHEELEIWFLATSQHELDIAIESAKQRVSRDFMGRGRPSGTTENPAFDLFVQYFYYFVKKAGGDPGSASKKGRNRVSGVFFTKAIPSLERAGQLPNGFVPKTENSKIKAFRKAEALF